MQLHVLLCFRGQHQQAVGAAHGHQPAGHLVTCREEGCGQSRYPSEMSDRTLTEAAVRTTFKRLVYDASDINQLTDVDHRASVMDGPATGASLDAPRKPRVSGNTHDEFRRKRRFRLQESRLEMSWEVQRLWSEYL